MGEAKAKAKAKLMRELARPAGTLDVLKYTQHHENERLLGVNPDDIEGSDADVVRWLSDPTATHALICLYAKPTVLTHFQTDLRETANFFTYLARQLDTLCGRALIRKNEIATLAFVEDEKGSGNFRLIPYNEQSMPDVHVFAFIGYKIE